MKEFMLLPYGAVLDGTSKDLDVIPCPSQLLGLLPNEQVDILYPDDSRSASHAYWNLYHDYGEEFAETWWETMDFEEKICLYSKDQWMEQNVSFWREKLLLHSHPRIWGKWMFARLQLSAYRTSRLFTNRKTKLLEHLRQKPEVLESLLGEFPNEAPLGEEKEVFLRALEGILLRGDDFSDDVRKILSLEIEREAVDGVGEDVNLVDIKVTFLWGSKTYVGNFKGTLKICVWTANFEDLQEIWEEENEFLLPEVTQISSMGSMKFNASHKYWDGYGL